MTDSRDDWERHWQDYHETAEENPAQNYRRSMVLSLLGINGTGQGARVMDIGSGQGDMAASVIKQFPAAEVMGLELSSSGVAISQKKVPQARFVQRNLLEVVEPPKEQRNWATHAICTEVLEHLEDPALLLQNARQYMAEGCRLVITVPGGPMSAFDKHIGHRKHWRPQEIEALMQQTGFNPERVSGAGFPFFNLYRCVVIMRGKKLISDVSAGPAGSTSLPARMAMTVFHGLIRRSLNSSRSGWQIVGTAICKR